MTIAENATLPSGIWDIDPVHSKCRSRPDT